MQQRGGRKAPANKSAEEANQDKEPLLSFIGVRGKPETLSQGPLTDRRSQQSRRSDITGNLPRLYR